MNVYLYTYEQGQLGVWPHIYVGVGGLGKNIPLYRQLPNPNVDLIEPTCANSEFTKQVELHSDINDSHRDIFINSGWGRSVKNEKKKRKIQKLVL